MLYIYLLNDLTAPGSSTAEAAAEGGFVLSGAVCLGSSSPGTHLSSLPSLRGEPSLIFWVLAVV